MGKIEVTHVLDFASAVFDKEHAYSMRYINCAYTTLRFQ